MTFRCPQCGYINGDHILTDEQMADRDMEIEGVQAKLDYAKGQLANIKKYVSEMLRLQRDTLFFVTAHIAILIQYEAEGD
jgi:hypothetical protein